MAKITKSYVSDTDLTIFYVEGELTFDEIWNQTHVFFTESPSKYALWDFTSGTSAKISSHEIKLLAGKSSSIVAKIEGGRCAIVAPKDIDYGLSRVFQAFSEFKNFLLEVKIFRDRETAQKWLMPDS